MNDIKKLFTDLYKQKPLASASAPGRLEILGNHTDYNEGIVLSAAVEQRTQFAFHPIDGDLCSVYDFRDKSKTEFNINEIDSPLKGDWGNYIKGVIVELRKKNIHIPAFNGAILSDIPLSAGMSSSAALEMSVAFAFKKAFNINLSNVEWAKVGQGVENNYMGLQTGLLDQFSSIYGEKNSLILCDFRKNEVLKTIQIPKNYVFVVVNSMVKHNLVNSDYNLRRIACENVVEVIQKSHSKVKALRDVSMEMLDNMKSSFKHIEYLRAKHVVCEISKVKEGVEFLERNNIEDFGKLMFDSHLSSKVNFENSCIELDYLVELAKSIPGALGARLSGGGFGGISIHLVEKQNAETYAKQISTAYKLQTEKEPEVIVCAIGDGAK